MAGKRLEQAAGCQGEAKEKEISISNVSINLST